MMFVNVQLPPEPPAQTQQAAAPSFDQQYEQARSQVKAGQLELALVSYTTLLQRSPGNADVLLARGIVFGRLHRYDEAGADLAAAIKAAPNYADAWRALGNIHSWNEQPAKAIPAYDRLIELEPNDADARIARARAYRAAGRAADARVDLVAARSLGASVEIDEPTAPGLPRIQPEASAPAGYRWAASASNAWTDPGRGARWNDQALGLRHYWERGSLAFETLRARRFGEQDYAWALDAYTRLWQGAYANIRYQHAPAHRLFPGNSGRVELYQSLGSGWEASISDDVLAFPSSRVNIVGAGLGKYVGNWYLQLRHQNILSPGSHSKGDRALARYYYEGDGDTYVEAAANSGRSDDAQSLVGGRAHSGGASFAWVRYWSPAWGTRVSTSFSRTDGAANERGMALSLYRRW
jgi:YaiO family outer membrane protein